MSLIAYTEKGAGLHAHLESIGLPIIERDGVWTALSDAAATQAAIDAYSPQRVAESLYPAIKGHARELIDARFPAWRQANMTARALELIDGLIAGTLTPEEAAELAAIRAAWGWVKSVRATSNFHESALAALAEAGDFPAVIGYDWRGGWPVT